MAVEFAVTDDTRFFKLNFAAEQRQSLIQIRNANRWKFQNNLVENWEEWTKKRTSNREKRVIVTGNILQAFDREEYAKGGKLISFTRKNGDVEKGILLRRDIGEKLAEKAARGIASVTLPIEKVKHIILRLPNQEGVQCSGKITVFHSWNDFRIFTAGSSKQEFEWLITNEKLIELAESDYGFQIARSQWNASFAEKDMPLVLDVLAELQVNARIEGAAAEQLQKELAAQTDKGNWKKLAWNESNIPAGTRGSVLHSKTKDSENERIRIAEAEAEALIFIMEMELELEKYKQVAGIENKKPNWVLFSIWRNNVSIYEIDAHLKNLLAAERKKLKNAKLYKDKDAILDYQDNINDLKSLSKYDFFVGNDNKIHFTKF